MSTTTLHRPSHTPHRTAGPASSRTVRSTATYRLTRRGRVVVLALGFVLVVLVGLVLAGGSVATGDKGTPPPTRAVVVAPGESMWSIASSAAGGVDVDEMITRIEELNGLDSDSLAAGQHLRVPIG